METTIPTALSTTAVRGFRPAAVAALPNAQAVR